jgi:hypothetical protein
MESTEQTHCVGMLGEKRMVELAFLGRFLFIHNVHLHETGALQRAGTNGKGLVTAVKRVPALTIRMLLLDEAAPALAAFFGQRVPLGGRGGRCGG